MMPEAQCFAAVSAESEEDVDPAWMFRRAKHGETLGAAYRRPSRQQASPRRFIPAAPNNDLRHPLCFRETH